MMVGQENPVTLVMEWIGCLGAPLLGACLVVLELLFHSPPILIMETSSWVQCQFLYFVVKMGMISFILIL